MFSLIFMNMQLFCVTYHRMKGLCLSFKIRPVSIRSNRDMINFVRKVKLAPWLISGWGKSVLFLVHFY